MNMPGFMDEQQIQSTSQLFSNIYLSRLDDFLKRELKLRHYGRYVDDFYIVGCCKEELLAAIPVIRCSYHVSLDCVFIR